MCTAAREPVIGHGTSVVPSVSLPAGPGLCAISSLRVHWSCTERMLLTFAFAHVHFRLHWHSRSKLRLVHVLCQTRKPAYPNSETVYATSRQCCQWAPPIESSSVSMDPKPHMPARAGCATWIPVGQVALSVLRAMRVPILKQTLKISLVASVTDDYPERHEGDSEHRTL